MQNKVSLLYILRTPSPNELLRSCLQALTLVSFIVFLFLYLYFVLAVEYHWARVLHCCIIGSRRLIHHSWCFLMILDLMLLVPQLITTERLQHPIALPCELLHRSHVTVTYMIKSGLLN